MLRTLARPIVLSLALGAGGGPSFDERLAIATRGLVYQSETDAVIEPYVSRDCRVETVDVDACRRCLGLGRAVPIVMGDAHEFFRDLCADRSWFGPAERERAARYRTLERLLRSELVQLRVFRVGRTSVRIYVVGKLQDGRLAGVVARAVET